MTPRGSPRSRRAQVFLVDDHAVLRAGLAELINRESDMRVCGEAPSAEEAMKVLASLAPDVVIVDLLLKGTSGLELLKNLKSRYPKLPVLVLSMHDESIFAERALRAGARGYIMKEEAVDEVHAAIRRVLGGDIYLSPRMSNTLLRSLTHGKSAPRGSPVDQLSDRELEVFGMIGKGVGTSAIAQRLHLSIKTIQTYRANLKVKLNLKDGDELLKYAIHSVRNM